MFNLTKIFATNFLVFFSYKNRFHVVYLNEVSNQ